MNRLTFLRGGSIIKNGECKKERRKEEYFAVYKKAEGRTDTHHKP